MTIRGRNISLVLAAPLMSVALLAGMASERRTYVTPGDVEPYHARAKAAIESIPYVIGYWTGKDDDNVPAAAQTLLRPNHILSRMYVDKQTDAWGPRDRAARLLIVQCRDSRDMLGHYPPRCYPSHGMTKVLDQERSWTVGDLTITGKEYHFTRDLQGQTHRTTVYNFFVVPAKSRDDGRAAAVADAIKRDMDAVRDAAEDYQQRHYGAAQFQVVFHGLSSADLPKGERDEIFATLIEPCLPVIKALATTTSTASAGLSSQFSSSSDSVSLEGSEFVVAYPSGELK
jgi:hypothetical protein